MFGHGKKHKRQIIKKREISRLASEENP